MTINHQSEGQLTIYHGLSDQEVAQLDTMSSQLKLDAQSYLFHQRSPAKSVYVVEEGELMIERTSASGKRQVMAFIFPGNFIGFTHSDYYEFGVQALTPARLTDISRRPFIEASNTMPQLKQNLRQIGSNVLAHTMDQMFALGQKKAHERVCFLLKLQLERPKNRERQKIDLVMTRQDIADHLGLTIETVSRAFSKLKKEGLIDIHSAHTIEVLDLEQLENLAQAD